MDFISSLDPRWLALALQVLRMCIWLVILTAIFTPLERLCALHPQRIFRKAILTDVGYYFLSSLVPSLLLSVPLAILAMGVHRFVPAVVGTTVAAWPLWLRGVAAMIVGEIGFYWGHRWSHEIPLLWRFHVVHHSAEHVDFLVNTRVHPVDMVFTRLCGLVPMYILGLAAPISGSSSVIPLLVLLVGTMWGFFIHANVRWRFGPLEWLIATPAFHHWHHTNDGPDVINKNYAAMLPMMDQVFGTMYLPRDKQPQQYGVDETLPPTMVGQLMHPFAKRAAPSSAATSPTLAPDHPAAEMASGSAEQPALAGK